MTMNAYKKLNTFVLFALLMPVAPAHAMFKRLAKRFGLTNPRTAQHVGRALANVGREGARANTIVRAIPGAVRDERSSVFSVSPDNSTRLDEMEVPGFHLNLTGLPSTARSTHLGHRVVDGREVTERNNNDAVVCYNGDMQSTVPAVEQSAPTVLVRVPTAVLKNPQFIDDARCALERAGLHQANRLLKSAYERSLSRPGTVVLEVPVTHEVFQEVIEHPGKQQLMLTDGQTREPQSADIATIPVIEITPGTQPTQLEMGNTCPPLQKVRETVQAPVNKRRAQFTGQAQQVEQVRPETQQVAIEASDAPKHAVEVRRAIEVPAVERKEVEKLEKVHVEHRAQLTEQARVEKIERPTFTAAEEWMAVTPQRATEVAVQRVPVERAVYQAATLPTQATQAEVPKKLSWRQRAKAKLKQSAKKMHNRAKKLFKRAAVVTAIADTAKEVTRNTIAGSATTKPEQTALSAAARNSVAEKPKVPQRRVKKESKVKRIRPLPATPQIERPLALPKHASIHDELISLVAAGKVIPEMLLAQIYHRHVHGHLVGYNQVMRSCADPRDKDIRDRRVARTLAYINDPKKMFGTNKKLVYGCLERGVEVPLDWVGDNRWYDKIEAYNAAPNQEAGAVLKADMKQHGWQDMLPRRRK